MKINIQQVIQYNEIGKGDHLIRNRIDLIERVSLVDLYLEEPTISKGFLNRMTNLLKGGRS